MAAQANGNGFISRQNFQAAIGALGMVLIVFGSFGGYVISSLRGEIRDLKDASLTKDEHKQYKEYLEARLVALDNELKKVRDNRATTAAVTAEFKRIDDRFNEFKSQTDRLFSERRDDIGGLRKDISGTTTLRDSLADLKREQTDQQKQILDIIRLLGAKVKVE